MDNYSVLAIFDLACLDLDGVNMALGKCTQYCMLHQGGDITGEIFDISFQLSMYCIFSIHILASAHDITVSRF